MSYDARKAYTSIARSYTLTEACAVLGTSERTMRRLVDTGEILAYHIPNRPRGRIHISERALNEYVRRCEGAEA